jgi:superfamily II DNA or RNA helicase
MEAKPFTWQEAHIDHLVDCLAKYPYALDASDTGTGKTFTSLFVAKALGQKPFVIAPKIVLSAWADAAKACGVSLMGVTNVEKLKAKNHDALHRLPNHGTKKYPISNWKWNLPAGTLVIWDEAQDAGGDDTQNARVMYALKQGRLPCLSMSATIADDPTRLKSLGYLLGLHDFTDFKNFCRRNGCVRNPWSTYNLMFSKNKVITESVLLKIHKEIFPEKGSRLRIADIKDFPDCSVMAEAYDLPDRRKIDAIYEELEEQLIEADDDDPVIVKILRARQNVELLKTPIFVELAREAIEEGTSVALFVNFRATFDAICEALKSHGVRTAQVLGGQNVTERDAQILSFQQNEALAITLMVQAGGVGTSLHDLYGRPRLALISPPYSSKDLKQVLGRIHRAGSKSKAIQKIVFVARTVEERTCEAVRRKLDNLSVLNDGDLSTGAGF